MFRPSQIEELVDKIATLQSSMSPSHQKPLPPVPSMHPEEEPMKEQEHSKESLLKFKEEMLAREEAERLAAAGGGDGGFFGGFGGGGEEEDSKETEEDDALIEYTDVKATPPTSSLNLTFNLSLGSHWY